MNSTGNETFLGVDLSTQKVNIMQLTEHSNRSLGNRLFVLNLVIFKESNTYTASKKKMFFFLLGIRYQTKIRTTSVVLVISFD